MLEIKERTTIEQNSLSANEITFSSLLGKSEESLKKEFYAYQIRKLFLKVSPLVYGNLEKEKISSIGRDLEGLEIFSLAVTPFT